jgi:hypothetical protein
MHVSVRERERGRKNGKVIEKLGFDFTNILCTAFTVEDLKSAKKTNDLTVVFVL